MMMGEIGRASKRAGLLRDLASLSDRLSVLSPAIGACFSQPLAPWLGGKTKETWERKQNRLLEKKKKLPAWD